jgi:hypothetical protein
VAVVDGSDGSDDDFADYDDGDNDSAWDSVDDESDTPFDDEMFFARDDGKPKKPLTKPSLLSSLFLNNPKLLQQQQQERRRANSNDTAGSSEDGIKPSEGYTEATVATHMPLAAAAFSPRTTRRNMLATELSESVRRNLLWERQQTVARPPQPPSLSMASSIADGSANLSRNPTLRRSMTTTGLPAVTSFGEHAANGNVRNVANDINTWKEDLDDSNLDFNYHARGW